MPSATCPAPAASTKHVGEIPVMRVVKATAENAKAVVGVVDQHYVVDEENGESLVRPSRAGPQDGSPSTVQSNEYLSVVTLGAYMVIRAYAGSGAIQPGDLLTPSPAPGYAMPPSDPSIGTVIGNALEGLQTGLGTIAVYVNLD